VQNPPDVYADGVSVGVGPFGYTVIFLRSEAKVGTGQQAVTNEIVSIVRMSRELVSTLRTSLETSLAAEPPPVGHELETAPE